MSVERKLEVLQFQGEWCYRFRASGKKWGHFLSEEEARKEGERHIARAIKYDNDYGLPPDQMNGMPMKRFVDER